MKFYSIGCVTCNQYKAILDSKGIEYEYITDNDTIMKVADENHIMSAPFMEVDGEILVAQKLTKYIQTL
jgi:glutaredoxin